MAVISGQSFITWSSLHCCWDKWVKCISCPNQEITCISIPHRPYASPRSSSSSSLNHQKLVTGASFILKGNIYAGIVIVACTIPTLLFNSIVLEKFLRPFRDASLRYTGKIYNTRNAKDETEDPWQAREEFRRWLVDCHKASYLPTCLSGGERNLLTAEPAMVVPKIVQPKEEIIGSADLEKQNSNMRNLFQRQTAQKGGIMRRQRFGIWYT